MTSNFKIYLQSSSKIMVDKEKKRGRCKYKNLNILITKRAFSMKQKSFFIVFEGLPLAKKNANLIKIADTIFKLNKNTNPKLMVHRLI